MEVVPEKNKSYTSAAGVLQQEVLAEEKQQIYLTVSGALV